jgi:hypothetical protein
VFNWWHFISDMKVLTTKAQKSILLESGDPRV